MYGTEAWTWTWLQRVLLYALVPINAIQVLAFVRATFAQPALLPAGWQEAALDPSGGARELPLRSYSVRKRGGEVVLGFDHDCFWLATVRAAEGRRRTLCSPL